MSEEFEEPKPKSNKKVLIGAVVGLLLLGGGGAAAYFGGFLGGGGEKGEGEASAEGEAKAEGEGEAKGEGEGEGAHVSAEGAEAVDKGMAQGGGSQITNLGAFTVNLRGSGGGRVLRMEVQLDSTAGTANSITNRSPQLRDTVITAVSDYTWAELEGVDGKSRLRDELLTRINGVLAPAVADRLYFTQFVVQ